MITLGTPAGGALILLGLLEKVPERAELADDGWVRKLGDWVVLKGVGGVLRSRWAAPKLPAHATLQTTGDPERL